MKSCVPDSIRLDSSTVSVHQCQCEHHCPSLSLQMSSYKRATLEEEEVSDAPAEAASSPDGVEVSEHNTYTHIDKEEDSV